MRYLLDTCVISELIKPDPEPQVIHWLRNQDEEFLFLSVLTMGEIRKGIAKLPPSQKKQRLDDWVRNDFKTRFADRILSVNDEIAELWGNIAGAAERAGRRLPVIDSLLCATALVHGLVFATRDTACIEQTGVKFINPWEDTVLGKFL